MRAIEGIPVSRDVTVRANENSRKLVSRVNGKSRAGWQPVSTSRLVLRDEWVNARWKGVIEKKILPARGQGSPSLAPRNRAIYSWNSSFLFRILDTAMLRSRGPPTRMNNGAVRAGDMHI